MRYASLLKMFRDVLDVPGFSFTVNCVILAMSFHPHKVSGFSELRYLGRAESGAFTNRLLGNNVKDTDFESESHPCLMWSEHQGR